MSKVLLFPHRPTKEELLNRDCQASTAILTSEINSLYNRGYDPLTILAALIAVTGRVLGSIDPECAKLDGREAVFALISKYADEQIVSMIGENK